MSTEAMTVVSTKGQVILPKSVRDALAWLPGTRLVVETMAEGVTLRVAQLPFAPTRVEDVRGCLAWTGPAKSIEEMKAGIAEAVRRRHAGG